VNFNWDKLKAASKSRGLVWSASWAYSWTVGLALVVIFYWDDVRALEHYGYLGAFLISVFGGATIIVPVPMTPVVFALGTVMAPSFAPYLGPIFVGAAAAATDAFVVAAGEALVGGPPAPAGPAEPARPRRPPPVDCGGCDGRPPKSISRKTTARGCWSANR
jgi:hypothetical protein